MLTRQLFTDINNNLFKNNIILIYGARRVGKTTLAQQLLAAHQDKKTYYFDCDLATVRLNLATTNDKVLAKILGAYDLVVIDEAQAIEDIGLILKIIHDHLPQVQIIATGSSSFDLANKTGEPLVGRNITYTLYPLAISELNENLLALDAQLDHILRFGLYPAVVKQVESVAKNNLLGICDGYLYKDILALDGIKLAKVLPELLRLLALQIGSEVSYNELACHLGISVNTVIRYIDLLEKCFVILVLPAFSRNLRNEVGIKSKKIYFYDIGIRNAIINNFAPLKLRNDIGALWENFCLVELIKQARNRRIFSNDYFWRSYTQQEVDYIQEYDGIIHAYEFKYSAKAKVKLPKLFTTTYNSKINVINRTNWHEFIGS